MHRMSAASTESMCVKKEKKYKKKKTVFPTANLRCPSLVSKNPQAVV